MALNLIIDKNIQIKDEEILNLFNTVLSISDIDKSDKDLLKLKKHCTFLKKTKMKRKFLNC